MLMRKLGDKVEPKNERRAQFVLCVPKVLKERIGKLSKERGYFCPGEFARDILRREVERLWEGRA